MFFQLRMLFVCVSMTQVMAGCAAVDQYSSRATAYNAEASETRGSTALLNILRATYRKPLQFTDVSTVTGIASATASVGSSIPFIGNGGTIAPMLGLSGGPNFGVANLNTQEFFFGIQSPLGVDTIGNLLAQGARPQVVLPLAIADVTIEDGKGRRRIKSGVESGGNFNEGYFVALQLIRAGLDTEPLDVPPAKASNKKSDDKNIPAPKPLKYRFCFDLSRSDQANEQYPNSNLFVATTNPSYRLVLARDDRGPIPAFTVDIPRQLFCGHQKDAVPKGVGLSFQTRSLEGIYTYLGSIGRLELGFVDDGPKSIEVPPGANPHGNGKSFTLFDLKRGGAGPLDPYANFGGASYYVSVDPSGVDASSEVLQLLSDLQALQSKASAFPQPSSVAVLSR